MTRCCASLFCLVPALFLLRCSSSTANTDVGLYHEFADTLATKILFVGSSYFSFNDLPGMFSGLAKAAGKKIAIGEVIKNGTYLEDHVRTETAAEAMKMVKWNYVLLQDAGSAVGYPDTHQFIVPPYVRRRTYWALTELTTMARENWVSTKTVFMMPWAFEDGLTWIRGQTDTYEDMQKKIYENTLAWAREIGFLVAPVGWAWRTVISEHPTLHYLFLSDYNHPSLRGSYLTACVLYVSVFKESVVGNGYHGGVPQEEAEYFQRVASQTVLNNFDLWNIPASAR